MKTMIPELIKRRASGQLEDFCLHHRDKLTCPHVDLLTSWEENAVTLEVRDGCNPPHPIARFCYSADLGQWSLFAPHDATAWRPCLDVQPSLNLEKLLAYLEADPLNLFWPPSFTCFS